MAMTKEERNKRKADLRFQTQQARYRDFLSTYIEIWVKAKDEGWPHRRMLEVKRIRVLTADSYQNGSQFIRYRLEGAWDALQQAAYRNGDLIGCYPHPDTGKYRPSKELNDQGLASRLDTKSFEFMWNRGDDKYVDKF